MSRRWVALIAALLVAACSSPPSQSPAPSLAGPTGDPSAVAPTGSPAPRPTPTDVPTAGTTAWTKVFGFDGGSLSGLIEGPEGLVAVGCRYGDDPDDFDCTQQLFALSADTVDWEVVEVDVQDDVSFGSLYRIGDRLFAIGYGYYGSSGGAAAMTSADGRAWSRVESASFTERAIHELIDSPAGPIGAGINAPIDSDNTSGFIVWPVGADGSFGKPRSVEVAGGPPLVSRAAWTGSEFLAWGHTESPYDNGPVIFLASKDSVAWELRSKAEVMSDQSVQSIAAIGDRLVAVGFDYFDGPRSPRAWTSTDGGRTWVPAVVPPAIAEMNDVAVLGSTFIARGEDQSEQLPRAASWSSTDGTTWVRLSDDVDSPSVPGFIPSDVVTLGDRTCAVGTIYADDLPPHAQVYCR